MTIGREQRGRGAVGEPVERKRVVEEAAAGGGGGGGESRSPRAGVVRRTTTETAQQAERGAGPGLAAVPSPRVQKAAYLLLAFVAKRGEGAHRARGEAGAQARPDEWQP